PLREDEVVEGRAVVGARLAELVRRVGEQAVVALLVPRQPVAAGGPLALGPAAGGDVVDAEPVAGRGILVLDRPRDVVPGGARLADHLLHVERAANERDGREDLRRPG